MDRRAHYDAMRGSGAALTGRRRECGALSPGCVVAFSGDLPPAVRAEEDSLYVVHIGGRKRPGS